MGKAILNSRKKAKAAHEPRHRAKETMERRLDEALKESFPASDPPAVSAYEDDAPEAIGGPDPMGAGATKRDRRHPRES